MGAKMKTYDGVNMLDEPAVKPYDHHCPLMGSEKFNYCKEQCLLRQKDKEQRDCYPVCKANKAISLQSTKQRAGSYKNLNAMRMKMYGHFEKGLSLSEVSKLTGKARSTVQSYKAEWNKINNDSYCL